MKRRRFSNAIPCGKAALIMFSEHLNSSSIEGDEGASGRSIKTIDSKTQRRPV
jgi:hypothetical protein